MLWKDHEESRCSCPTNLESVLAIEMPSAGGGAVAVASFVATEVDCSRAAMCGHLQGAPVALTGESVGGVYIGGKGVGVDIVCWGRAEIVGGLVLHLRVVRQHVKQLRENDSFPPVQQTRASLIARIFRLKVTAVFLLSFNMAKMKLIDVAYVPSLSYHLLS